MRRMLFPYLVSTVLLGGAAPVLAQSAVERNIPPAPSAPAAAIAAPDIVPASQDDVPLGATVRAIVLLSAGDAITADTVVADGVATDRVPALDSRRSRAALGRFVGRPLSRRLIAEIEATIARLSRNVGRPFVSLSTPAQEITDGVLRIRVTEFRLGAVDVAGVTGDEAIRIARALRVHPDRPVDSISLAEDLDWLNRTPFRHAAARFAPADRADLTDLTVVVEPRRPFRLYAGSSNTGSQSTGLGRLFVGGLVQLPFLPGGYASYQLTGSRDFWFDDGLFGAARPRYRAQGLRMAIPTFVREDIELTLSDALTNQRANADFTVRQRTTEATLAYRSALSNIGLPAGSGDLLVGVEAKRQHREVFFGELTALDVSADIWQALAGWSKDWVGNGRQGSAGLNLHVSPGGLSDRSSSARLDALNNGRIASNRYAYATIDLSQSVRLPYGAAFSGQFSVQYADRAIPLSAQMGLGGEGLVRGYTPDDGSFDAGLLSRNEFHLAPMRRPLGDELAPYVFADAGFGRDRALGTTTTLVSAGVGADYRLGRLFAVGANVGVALTDGQRTRSGNGRLQVRATLSF